MKLNCEEKNAIYVLLLLLLFKNMFTRLVAIVKFSHVFHKLLLVEQRVKCGEGHHKARSVKEQFFARLENSGGRVGGLEGGRGQFEGHVQIFGFALYLLVHQLVLPDPPVVGKTQNQGRCVSLPHVLGLAPTSSSSSNVCGCGKQMRR